MLRSLPFVFALAFFMAGCKTDHESIMKDTISKFKDLVSVMKGVTDEASAKAAVPKIQAISADMNKLQDEAKKLGDPTPEKDAELKKKFESEMGPVMQDFVKEAMRIGMNPALKPAADALKNLPKSM